MSLRNRFGVMDAASNVIADVLDLVRGELTLARIEIDETIHRLMLAAIWLVGGALVAFAGLVVLLEGAAAALAQRLPLWASLSIVGGVIVIVGGVFAFLGLRRISIKTVLPARTTYNLKKDVGVVREFGS